MIDPRKEMSIFLTEECNRSCSYCDIPTLKKPKRISYTALTDIFIPVVSHPSLEIFHLTGGEIGTLDEDKVDYIFSAIRSRGKKLTIRTNGLFLEKYGDRYASQCETIYVHSHKRYSFSNVKYMFPLTSTYVSYIRRKYGNSLLPDNICPCLFSPKKKINEEKMIPTRDQLLKLIPNIPKLVRLRSEKSLDLVRFFCRKYKPTVSIDLTNGVIIPCICSHTRGLEKGIAFSEENLDSIVMHKNQDLRHWDMPFCKSCYQCIFSAEEIVNNFLKGELSW